jgi:hypothetical protein
MCPGISPSSANRFLFFLVFAFFAV